MSATVEPTAAERICSVCTRRSGATLAVAGVDPVTTGIHHLLDDGSFAVSVPTAGSAARQVNGREAEAVLELTDYAPLPLREPVRSLVWIRGRLARVPLPQVSGLLDAIAADDPHPALLLVDRPGLEYGLATDRDARHTLLHLRAESVVVADSVGAESVTPDALLAACPDPLSAVESGWLRHLATHHPEVLDRLAARLPASLRRGQILPLGVDRYGVRLRVEREDGDRDVRLAFYAPVDDLVGLNGAIHVLMGCPFRNGLRARGPRD